MLDKKVVRSVVFVCVSVCVCICVCMYACVYLCVSVCVCMCVHTYEHRHVGRVMLLKKEDSDFFICGVKAVGSNREGSFCTFYANCCC